MRAKRGAVCAIDTNILVRFLTEDDAAQYAAARGIFVAGEVFISTVLLESERVLRSGYDLVTERVVEALRNVAGLPGVTVEAPAALPEALQWAGEGMDFADALHLSGASHCESFLTFDRKFARAAKDRARIPVLLA